jgi:hypothetical protein
MRPNTGAASPQKARGRHAGNGGLSIVGDLDPNRDADWNNFQSQLRNLGIDRYLRIIQTAYDASAFAK